MSDETYKKFAKLGNELVSENEKRAAKEQNEHERLLLAKERIPNEIAALRSELDAERKRAEKAETSGRVFSLLSSILAVLIAYLIEHHKEIISFFL